MNAAQIEDVSAAVIPPPQPAPEALEIRWVPIAHVIESPDNPRQIYPASEMEKLTQSMRQSGFRPWQPLIVRPLPDDVWRMPGLQDQELFELGAGHRRRRGAGGAELEYVPVIVRKLSDEEFLDVLNFDNSGREDVHPLHEASGWMKWMQKTGKGVADIAARIGQSIGYVYQRLKYDDLIDEAKHAFLDNKFTPGHAILIARESDQKKALKLCQPPAFDPNGKIPSVREFAMLLRRDLHVDLSRAAFDKADETLVPQAGACVNCPKHTKNAPGLPESSDGDECMDSPCFARKLGAHLVQIEAKLKREGRQYVRISGHMVSRREGVLGSSAYTLVDKNAKGAIPAIVIDGSEAGHLVYVTLLPAREPSPVPGSTTSQGPASPSSPSRVGSSGSSDSSSDQTAREAALEREQKIRLAIYQTVRNKIERESITLEDLRRLVDVALGSSDWNGGPFFCQARNIELQKGAPDPEVQSANLLQKALPSMPDAEIIRLVIEIGSGVGDELDTFAMARGDSAKGLYALAKRFKVDHIKIRRQMSEADKEAEGGTRREAEKKTTAPAKASPAKTRPKPSAAKPAVAKKPAPKAPAKKAKAVKPAKSKKK